ncbi:hypothetical protein KOR34_35320 [Posidoniimonas corsicana]|uniref:Uncharacterized protein n=1 Tax=Posidoniimonas corsicana TaxID=1938618 RepID=A0A5C5V719_9BACT|nr:hypothetical protein [Posidoniimonas corsicana]TWT33699.1 hypothetical protein KOR34_35320 [Posidoniimonas corsicana]
MPAPPPQKLTVREKPRRKNRQRNQLLITGGVLAVLSVIVAAVLLTSGPPKPTATGPAATPAAPPVDTAADGPGDAVQEESAPPEPAGPQLVDDDGRTLWASPTDGGPISLAYLPPGCDLILHCRPAELLASPAGEGSLRALGPQGIALLRGLAAATGLKLREIDRLLIGVRGAGGAQLEAALVVTPLEPLARQAEALRLPPPYANLRAATHEGASYHVGAPWCGFAPEQEDGRLFVVAPRAALHEVIEAAGAAPPLRREVELLAAQIDGDRHATLLAAPSFFFTDGRALFTGVTESLESPVFEFLPDALRAGSLSLHWGDDFYAEARGVSAAEVTPTRLASQLKSRIAGWPSDLQLAVLDLNPAPHGRRVVAQLPAMLRLLAEYTRTGVEDDAAVLNAYLPLPAGENLLAASELMLAQLSSGAVGAPGTTATAPPAPRTIEQKLGQEVSVSFARDTLEMAVKYLADEMQAPIVIVGSDLQLEGITKNQSFGMQAARQPAQQVLLEILQRANPDRTATGPADEKQKLVYTVRPDDTGRPTIYITTRSAAQKRGDKLPSVFLPAGGS